MLEQGAIQESYSLWASPIVLVSKLDGSVCFSVETTVLICWIGILLSSIYTGFSRIVSPLFILTMKNVPYVWNSDCQKAFEELKDHLNKAPVLVFPDFAESFILETDASGLGLRAVLSQKQLDGKVAPITYASRTFQQHKKNYGISELEAHWKL